MLHEKTYRLRIRHRHMADGEERLGVGWQRLHNAAVGRGPPEVFPNPVGQRGSCLELPHLHNVESPSSRRSHGLIETTAEWLDRGNKGTRTTSEVRMVSSPGPSWNAAALLPVRSQRPTVYTLGKSKVCVQRWTADLPGPRSPAPRPAVVGPLVVRWSRPSRSRVGDAEASVLECRGTQKLRV